MTSLEEAFVKGQSDNLPQVDNITMFSFLGKHPDFMGAEMKGVKAKGSLTFPHPKRNTIRLNVELKSATDDYYNIINYKSTIENFVGKENIEMYGLEKSNLSNSFNQYDEYIEDTYIDNSEVLRDSYPHGVNPEIDGFFVNKGKLKLKCDANQNAGSKKVEKLLIKRGKVSALKKSKKIKKHEWKVLKKKENINVQCESKLKKDKTTICPQVLLQSFISPYFMHRRLSPVVAIPKLRLPL